jgi:hypothetical protein
MIKDSYRINRRQWLKFIGITGVLISTNPLYAFNIFDVIDPKGKSKDIQKAKKIFEAADSLRVSATGLDYKSEFSIGESLALEGFRRYGLPVADTSVQKYVFALRMVCRACLWPTWATSCASTPANSASFCIPFIKVELTNIIPPGHENALYSGLSTATK